MSQKILNSILLVAAVVLLASVVIIMGCLYGYFDGVQEAELKDELSLATVATEQGGMEYLSQLSSDGYRITWIDSDGTVLYDTQADASTMENHADRDEIKEALKTGYGSSVRYSATLLEKTQYEARRLSDGTVLRISVDRATTATLVLGMLQPIIIVVILAVILSVILAKKMARKIVEPLNELDLDHPLENDAYEELSPLLGRINQQHYRISSQVRALKRKTDEFEQITGSMREGLVLLDSKGKVISINPAAMEIFGADKSCIGEDFLTVDRTHDITSAIHSAIENGHSEIRVERAGMEYQFDFSEIKSEGVMVGTVILAFNVTEQAFAERNRREFTANVSHELKTPLQSIISSAELIENGLVKQEDMPRFIGYIRTEATRLVSLIEDIIRLSQLDEGSQLPQEEVCLFDIATEVISALKDRADSKNIKLSLSGDGGNMNGAKGLLYEIIYNLCDNAIKYNNPGGTVSISIADTERDISLSVKDTGIGIAPEHQSRVFERFYRVDKSHSKQSGGTGLGLSIVKHAVAYHNGKIHLTSEAGKGTEITITFPKTKSK